MFDIPANCVFTMFEKWDLLNKYDTIMDKILGNEELTGCTRSDPVIYFVEIKILEFLERKTCRERNNLCIGNRYCIIKNKANTTKTSFMRQAKSVI